MTPPASPHSPRTSIRPADLGWILAVVAAWGFAFVPIRVALDEVPPFALAALRFFFAAMPAIFFLRRPAMPWRYIAGYGIAIGAVQFGLLFLGVALGMPVGLSSLVIQVQVFFTIALAVAFAGDRLAAASVVGGAIAALGIVVLAAYKLMEGMTATFAGFACVVAAGLAWGVGNVIAKKAGQRYRPDMLAMVVWSSIVPVLPLAIVAWLFEGGTSAVQAVANASWKAWACVLVMSWGATLFGFGSWAALMHRYSAALVSPFALLIPIFGMAFAALLLGERLAPMQFAGAALVFAGLLVNVFGQRAWRVLAHRAR